MNLRTEALALPSERTLWIVLIALTMGDAVSTLVALDNGLGEANPAITTFIDAFGPVGIILSQGVYLCGALVLVRLVENNGRKPVLATGIALSALVVLNNTAAILFV